jgi:hypothetical protein
MRASVEASEAEIKSLIDQVDANGDGELQLDEFETFWKLFKASCEEAAEYKQRMANGTAEQAESAAKMKRATYRQGGMLYQPRVPTRSSTEKRSEPPQAFFPLPAPSLRKSLTEGGASRSFGASGVSGAVFFRMRHFDTIIGVGGSLESSNVAAVQKVADALSQCLPDVIQQVLASDPASLMVHHDAAGGTSFVELRLLTGTAVSFSLQLFEADARTITSVQPHIDHVSVSLLGGEIAHKLLEVLPNGVGKPVFRYHRADVGASGGAIGSPVSYEGYIKVVDRFVEAPPRYAVIRRGALHTMKAEKRPAVLLAVKTAMPPVAAPATGVACAAATAGATAAAATAGATAAGDDAAARVATSYYWSDTVDWSTQPASCAGPPKNPPLASSVTESEHFVRTLTELWREQRASRAVSGASLPSLFRGVLADALKHRCLALSARLKERRVPELWPSDSTWVRGIGNAAALMIAAGGSLDATKPTQSIYNNEALVIRRYSLYEDQYVQMRLHLFPNAAETYVHNHRTNFISTALAGSYVHQTWQIRNGQGASSSSASASPDGGAVVTGTDWHYERTRDSTGALTERQRVSGSLHMADTFRHDPQHAYFLQNQLFHSVQVEKEASMLSLFVKDNQQNGGTKVLEPRDGDGPASLAALPEVINSYEINLEGAAKQQAIRDIETQLKISGDLMMSSNHLDDF